MKIRHIVFVFFAMHLNGQEQGSKSSLENTHDLDHKNRDRSTAVTQKTASQEPESKPGVLTIDEETGDMHIEIPADDESDSDQ